MMEREDWEEALKTPIGMLPTGSGNALCASTLYEAGSVRMQKHTNTRTCKMGYLAVSPYGPNWDLNPGPSDY